MKQTTTKKNKGSVLITGASSGIGKYATTVLANRGHIIWAGYYSDSSKQDLLDLKLENVKPVQLDVTDQTSIDRAKQIIANSHIPLRAIINNAGVALGGPIEVVDLKEITKLYEVNVFGMIRVIQNFLPLLRKTEGRVVNMSSVAGLLSTPFLSLYSSSKYAVEGLSDGLRRELRQQKVKVVLIEPGAIKTPIWKKSWHWSQHSFDSQDDRLEYYQPSLNHFMQAIKEHSHQAMSLAYLQKPIIKAVESSRPKLRYLVYRHALLFRIVVKLVPARLIDRTIKFKFN